MGFLIVRFDDTGDGPPAAPANALNVVFAGVPSNNDPTQLNVSAAIQGDGDASHFLNGQGQFVPAGSSSGFDNLVVIPQLSGTGAVAGYTCWIQIPASCLLRSGAKIKLGLYVAATNVVIASAVIRRANAFGTSFIDSTPITWGSSATPTFSSTGLQVSDEITVAADPEHDIWVLVYFDPTTTGSVSVDTGLGSQTPDFIPGYQFGDQTATAMGSLSSAAGYLKGIQQILTE